MSASTGKRVSRETACVRLEGVSEWCLTHHAYFLTGRSVCWATVRHGDPDPLDVTTREGYDSTTGTMVPFEPTEPPVVDDRWMVLFWIALALLFVAILVGTAYAVGLRAHGG